MENNEKPVTINSEPVYPNASFSRTEPNAKRPEARTLPEAIVPKGGATMQKRSALRRVKSNLKEDGSTIKDWLVNDILIPTGKRCVSGIVDHLLYGQEDRSRGLTSINGGSTGGIYKSYNGYSSIRPAVPTRPAASAVYRGGARSTLGIDDVLFKTRMDAIEVYRDMYNTICTGRSVSVAQYYAWCGLPTAAPTYWEHGWVALRAPEEYKYGAPILDRKDGWILDLPDPVDIRGMV